MDTARLFHRYQLVFLILCPILFACDREPVHIIGHDFTGSDGVFIINEGNFTYDNSSLSFYEFSTAQVYNGIFYAANEVNLGDVANSMIIYDGKGYIVVNNSGKIYIINPNTARMEGKLTGFTSPRNIYILNDNKGYVTDMYAMTVFIIDPADQKITGRINVCNNQPFNQHSTEQMVSYLNYIFIACWSYDNKILVLDTATDSIIDSVTVTKQPNSIAIDRFNKLWVLSDGGFQGSSYGQEKAALTRIDAETRIIEQVMQFPNWNDSPSDLVVNGSGDTLYYILHGIRKMSITGTQLPADTFIKARYVNYYSIGVDPFTSVIYAGDAVDYQQNGLIYRFFPNGEIIDSFRVGINPGAFCFKY